MYTMYTVDIRVNVPRRAARASTAGDSTPTIQPAFFVYRNLLHIHTYTLRVSLQGGSSKFSILHGVVHYRAHEGYLSTRV